mgnify:CR=1 FL=1
MKLISVEGKLCKFLFGNRFSFGISSSVQFSMDPEAFFCCCVADKIDDQLTAQKWLSLPVHTDMAEHPVLNFVPFARPGRKMRNGYLQAGFIGKLLQLFLPKTASACIAAPAISRNVKPVALGIRLFANAVPPFPNRFNRKFRCVMVDSN